MKEQYIELQTLPTIINLEDRAFLDAGTSGGNATSYSNKLHTIFSGALLDENAFSAKSPEQRRILQEEINSLEQKIIRNEKGVSELNDLIEENKVKIIELKSTRDDF